MGTRLIADRWSPERGTVRSTVTVYDDLPWIDITNVAEAVGSRPLTFLFH
ncbi:MAG: hypothetical protein GWO22_00415, partial [Actinobacteria bacterium]|nr:hypothetical protein [Actinomycetota bacterium]